MPRTTAATRRGALVLPGALALLAAGTITTLTITSGAGRRAATLPAGTVFIAALDRAVSSRESQPGDPVRLATTEPVRFENATVVASGAVLHGEVTHAEQDRLVGPALTLHFVELEADGRRYRIESEPFRIQGTRVEVARGGSAAGGGILGGFLAGEPGAAAGTLAGTVIGNGIDVPTDGNALFLPAGARLRIQLTTPVVVTYRPARGS